jgi:hypothetical protein
MSLGLKPEDIQRGSDAVMNSLLQFAAALRPQKEEPKPAPFPWTWISVGAAAAIGTGAYLLYKRSKGKPKARNPHKDAPVGFGARFRELKAHLTRSAKRRGYPLKSAGGLAAYIGRKKYGTKKFAAMAAAGRRRAKFAVVHGRRRMAANVSGVKTKTYDEGGMKHIKYHSTDVVSFSPTQVILRSGGWLTVTTKKRMNDTSREYGLGFDVYQKRGDWFVKLPSGKVVPFRDQMVISR